MREPICGDLYDWPGWRGNLRPRSSKCRDLPAIYMSLETTSHSKPAQIRVVGAEYRSLSRLHRLRCAILAKRWL